MIGDVLTCGRVGGAGGLADGIEMQRVDIDAATFPDAICNDGSGPVFYFRPATDPGSADRWVIQLQGGGGCHSGESCAERWCMVDTGFSMTQMSSDAAPTSGIDGKGIMDARPVNPLGHWNHVFIRYCSSDSWVGVEADVDLQTTVEGPLSDYRIHFLGSRVLDAAIDALRRDGTPPLDYTQGGATVVMPDLDDAEVVLLAGASAGGQGVTSNVDRIADHLQANNTGCGGGGCPLQVVALIDSAFAPALAQFDFSVSVPCTDEGLCDYQSIVASSDSLFTRRGDASCVEWHQANAPATAWQCIDAGHVIRQHISTPFFIRMGQEDALLSSAYVNSRYAIQGQGLLDLAGFAELVRSEVADLSNIQTTADEGAAITVLPGAFSPSCSEHETLRNNPQTFSAMIEVAGVSKLFFDTMGGWLSGSSPSVAITPLAGVEICPGAVEVPTLSPGMLSILMLCMGVSILLVLRHRAAGGKAGRAR